ncbi:uncharacterized protein EAE98_011179 [Botrytis deweyae]|uniref:Ecp2 effector protein domain-containing protein n=1 Tax=Botrytis deweyae TaxID=2478750 RepID=A0ABQ7I6F7_9HELO|nr:uncharacterized protein EAE98_011179 [Botrytis deweyae]KAF7915313.1 hypothetical protein EAE98_011179 [Botrytis deweyae]
MKYLAFAFIVAISALVSYADPLPDLLRIVGSHTGFKSAPTSTPTPQLCAQKQLAFGDKTCTYVYQFSSDDNGDNASARSFIIDTNCVILQSGEAPIQASTSNWSYQFRTCNIVKLNEVIKQKWEPTNAEYLMPLYQSDGQVSKGRQRGPSENGHGNKREDCTLKYNDLPDKGARYAWICPFECPC